MAHYKYGNNIKEFVLKYRQREGITQAQLASMLHVHPQYVSNVERGIYEAPVMFSYNFSSLLGDEESKYFLSLLDEARDDSIYTKIVNKKALRKPGR
jgi:transcriptional regulator with XRE-family HTH domain